MVGCTIGSQDKVRQQISNCFYKKVLCHSGVFAQSIYWYLDKGAINYCLYPLDSSGGYLGLVFAAM